MLVAYETPGAGGLAAHGPILDVIVSGPAGEVRTQALVDTGSSMSSVAADVLERVGGVPAGTRQVWTIAQEPLVIPAHSGVCISTVDRFHLCENIPLVLATGLQPPIEVLLGRDALSGTQFAYDGGAGVWYVQQGPAVFNRGSSPWGAILAAAAAGTAAGLAGAAVGYWLRRR